MCNCIRRSHRGPLADGTDDDDDKGNGDKDGDADDSDSEDDEGVWRTNTKALDTKALTAQTLTEKGRNIGQAERENAL